MLVRLVCGSLAALNSSVPPFPAPLEALRCLSSQVTSRARRISRCQRCHLSLSNCVCSAAVAQPSGPSRCQFVMLTHPRELARPSNTGKLLSFVQPETKICRWQRPIESRQQLFAPIEEEVTRREAEMQALQEYLQNLEQPPVLLYPPTVTDAALKFDIKSMMINTEADDKDAAAATAGGQKRVVLMLDGRWPETKKMYQQFEFLKGLPVLSFDQPTISFVRGMLGFGRDGEELEVLREAQRLDQVSTIEAVVYTLALFGDMEVAQQLHQLMRLFFARYHADKESLVRL